MLADQRSRKCGSPGGAQMEQATCVGSLMARLMSLSERELECLHADRALMRQLAEARLSLERRLHLSQEQHLKEQHLEQQQQQVMQATTAGAKSVAYISADARYVYQFGACTSQPLDLRVAPRRPLPASVEHTAAAARHPPNPKKAKLGEWRKQAAAREQQVHEQQQQQPLQQVVPHLEETDMELEMQETSISTRPVKRYKGEFDEPTWAEVEQRQRELTSNRHNYHRALGEAHQHLGECACVLGSRFPDQQPVGAVLELVERWARLPTGRRLELKWDLSHLPLDIPLADIKKYEDLRRDASGGRADFGGASKRKPLGIRGTRQFLLILYCLWGHPGRRDQMQADGYCPHCFAKIKKQNEQSTLVRVVNHFNMKHRKGANPRLSPRHPPLPASGSQVARASCSPASSPVAASPASLVKAAPTRNRVDHTEDNLFANLLLLAAASSSQASAEPATCRQAAASAAAPQEPAPPQPSQQQAAIA